MAHEARPGFPSVMFYCHDAYGIGHLKRASRLGRYLLARWPAMTQLIVTSSTEALTAGLEDRVDYVKLPSVRRVPSTGGDSGYIPRVLPVEVASLTHMRRDILLDIVRHFHPDVLVVDYTPAGLAGELTPSLQHLKASSPGTRFVAGFRDIVGNPPRVREAWARDGVHELLENLYDLILVYGQPDIFDLAAEMGLAARAAGKIRYTGYLGAEVERPSPHAIREELALRTGRLVLVTIGGGADGVGILKAMLAALRRWPERARFECLLVEGPMMSAGDRRRLEAMLPVGGRARLIGRVDDLVPYLAAADVVVSRGGYNSVCEILSLDRPSVIVPRETFNGVEDTEQLMRARALEQRGLVHVVREAELTPARLLESVNTLLETPLPAGKALGLDGLPVVAAALEGLLSDPSRGRA
jgi:predicted glycosyltransferase